MVSINPRPLFPYCLRYAKNVLYVTYITSCGKLLLGSCLLVKGLRLLYHGMSWKAQGKGLLLLLMGSRLLLPSHLYRISFSISISILIGQTLYHPDMPFMWTAFCLLWCERHVSFPSSPTDDRKPSCWQTASNQPRHGTAHGIALWSTLFIKTTRLRINQLAACLISIYLLISFLLLPIYSISLRYYILLTTWSKLATFHRFFDLSPLLRSTLPLIYLSACLIDLLMLRDLAVRLSLAAQISRFLLPDDDVWDCFLAWGTPGCLLFVTCFVTACWSYWLAGW